MVKRLTLPCVRVCACLIRDPSIHSCICAYRRENRSWTGEGGGLKEALTLKLNEESLDNLDSNHKAIASSLSSY